MTRPTPGFFPPPASRKVILSAEKLTQLANDLAKEARDKKDVLADYNLSEEEYYEIEQIPYFKRALDAATLAWHAPINTKARLEMGSQTYLETIIPSIAKGALDEKQPLNARTDAARFLAKVGGVGEKEQSANESAEKFLIQINIGADKAVTYDKTIEKIPETPALPEPP